MPDILNTDISDAGEDREQQKLLYIADGNAK